MRRRVIRVLLVRSAALVGGVALLAGAFVSAERWAARRDLDRGEPSLLCLGGSQGAEGWMDPETGLVYRIFADDVFSPWEFWQPWYVDFHNAIVRREARSGRLDPSNLRKRVKTRRMMEERFASGLWLEGRAGMAPVFGRVGGVGGVGVKGADVTRLRVVDAEGVPLREFGNYSGSVRFIVDEAEGLLFVWDPQVDAFEVRELKSGLLLQRFLPEEVAEGWDEPSSSVERARR